MRNEALSWFVILKMLLHRCLDHGAQVPSFVILWDGQVGYHPHQCSLMLILGLADDLASDLSFKQIIFNTACLFL